MDIILLESIKDVYIAYKDVKSNSYSLETEVNIDDYLNKVFEFGKVYAAFDSDYSRYCGFIAVYMNNFETKTAYISLLRIDPDYKRRHIGTELLSYSENQAKKVGMEFMRLEVKKSNYVAINFYEKNNYKFDNKESNTSLFMIKKL
ncbi:MAG: GNAT family N-acetyltransferase [Candidatus Gastranaerophilaceae bacterium]